MFFPMLSWRKKVVCEGSIKGLLTSAITHYRELLRGQHTAWRLQEKKTQKTNRGVREQPQKVKEKQVKDFLLHTGSSDISHEFLGFPSPDKQPGRKSAN